MWRPDCQAAAAWDAVAGVVDAGQAVVRVGGRVADGVGQVAGAANDLAAPVGGLAGAIPLLLVLGLVWLLARLVFGTARTAKQAAPAVIKGYTGFDVAEMKAKPKQTGEKVGRQLRVRREQRRGPLAGVHTGQQTEVVDRRNDSQGRPVRITVCATNSFEAEALLRRRMTGHRWSYTGSRPCDLQPRMNHHSYTNNIKKGGARR